MFEINREDMKIIEGHIINLDKLKLRLGMRKQELLEMGNIFCHTDDYHRKLSNLIEAIEGTFDGLSEDVKIIWSLKYNEPELNLGTWKELAEEFNYSKTSLLRVRENYLKEIATKIGYVSISMEEEKEDVIKTKRNVSSRTRFEILKRDNFRCIYCGRSPQQDDVKIHVDHVKPLSKGGSNEVDNLVTSCDECNLGKSDNEL